MVVLTSPNSLMERDVKTSSIQSSPIDMKEVATIILGGGEGTRLYPLTLTRCKPAVCFGGKYRLIDIPISNAIHSGCNKNFILTQFLSSSLHQHIFLTYQQSGKSSGLVEVLTAEQKPKNKDWFQGTADAVRQNLDYLLECPVDYFLILSGDQIYNFDLRELLALLLEKNADIVIASLPVNAQDVSRMGILKINSEGFVIDFHEKPKEQALLQKLRSSPETLEKIGIKNSNEKHYLGSMGIYLFKRKALFELLTSDFRQDFGKHLIPTAIQSKKVAAFLYSGFWEDIGTIESFYNANISLTRDDSPFNLSNEIRPIFSRQCDLTPAKLSNTRTDQSIFCEGSNVKAEEIKNSIIGPRSVIGKGTIIHDSYVLGNDYYSSTKRDYFCLPELPIIGDDCILKRVIVDKNVRIGNGVQLINRENVKNYDGENIFIRDGIIIVSRGATIPDRYVI